VSIRFVGTYYQEIVSPFVFHGKHRNRSPLPIPIPGIERPPLIAGPRHAAVVFRINWQSQKRHLCGQFPSRSGLPAISISSTRRTDSGSSGTDLSLPPKPNR
jgi:hypothetical protein